LTGVPANSFTYSGATVTNAANSGVVTITFPATGLLIKSFDLSMRLEAPVVGAAPSKTDITGTGYTGTVAWQTSDGADFTGSSFAADVYRAKVALTAKDGYTIAQNIKGSDFIHTRASGVKITGQGSEEYIIIITFKQAGEAPAPVQVSFSGLSQDESINLTEQGGRGLSWEKNETLAVSAPGFAAYEWYKDGTKSGTGSELVVKAQELPLGGHTVTVKVKTSGGQFYSKIVYFTIER
jgi:hypothetical protein